MILPSFTLGLLPLAVCTRLTRAATLEVMQVASILARDTVVLGITVLIALLIIVANLVVDIVHALLDPRVRSA